MKSLKTIEVMQAQWFRFTGHSLGICQSSSLLISELPTVADGRHRREWKREKKSLFSSTDCCIFTLPQGHEQVYYLFLPVCGGCYLTLIAARVFVLGPAVPQLTTLSCKRWINPSALSEVCPILHLIPSYYSTGLANYLRCGSDVSFLCIWRRNQSFLSSRFPTCTCFSSRFCWAVNRFDPWYLQGTFNKCHNNSTAPLPPHIHYPQLPRSFLQPRSSLSHFHHLFFFLTRVWKEAERGPVP